MSKKSIVLIGGGGHCRSCIDVIEAVGSFDIVGIVDMAERVGETMMNYKIIADDNGIEGLAKEGHGFLITLGGTKDLSKRVKQFDCLTQYNAPCVTAVSPLGYVASSASLGEGSIVLHQALVNAQAKVGKNCIINTKSLIEHDAVVGDHCHISTGSIVNGSCSIGKRVFLGSNSVVADGVTIADDVVIGAGSVVVNSIVTPGIYVGSPARKVS